MLSCLPPAVKAGHHFFPRPPLIRSAQLLHMHEARPYPLSPASRLPFPSFVVRCSSFVVRRRGTHIALCCLLFQPRGSGSSILT